MPKSDPNLTRQVTLDDETDIEGHADVLYSIYTDTLNNGAPPRTWGDLPEAERQAWRAVARQQHANHLASAVATAETQPHEVVTLDRVLTNIVAPLVQRVGAARPEFKMTVPITVPLAGRFEAVIHIERPFEPETTMFDPQKVG